MVMIMSLEDRSGRIRRDSAVSVAAQLATDLQADIDTGAIPPDTRLPSEAELAQQYGVARITVRAAIALLRDARKVVTVHGRGSFTAPSG